MPPHQFVTEYSFTQPKGTRLIHATTPSYHQVSSTQTSWFKKKKPQTLIFLIMNGKNTMTSWVMIRCAQMVT